MPRDLVAHSARARRQDRVVTGVLTAIVDLVLLLLAALIAYILYQGLPVALMPGFLTNSPLDEESPGILFELFDSFYLLLWALVISVPISLGASGFPAG